MNTRILFCALFSLIAISHLQALRISMPFKLAGKMIILPATVNGVSGNFILDTGIPHAVLNASYFDGQKVARAYHGVNGTTTEVKADHVKVQLGAMTWKGVYAEILPLAHLETIKGLPILGLLGGRMLRNYTLWIDYAQQLIWLEKEAIQWETPFFNEAINTPLVTQAFRFKNGSPCIDLKIGDHPFKFSLDTGAETNIIDSKYKNTLSPFYNLEEQKVLSSFSKTSQSITSTLLYGMKLEGLSCQPMVTTFCPISELNTSTKGPKVAGILGYEFLSQFKLCINFKDRLIYLIPDYEKQNQSQYFSKK